MTGLYIYDNFLISTGYDKINIWDLNTYECIKVLNVNTVEYIYNFENNILTFISMNEIIITDLISMYTKSIKGYRTMSKIIKL